jgi:hypothetical protein
MGCQGKAGKISARHAPDPGKPRQPPAWQPEQALAQSLPVFTGTLYYDEHDGPDPERSYAMTAAHEVGHPLLTHAFGAKYSWGHAGTSTLLGRRYDSAPECPAQGEISLMLYYNRNTSCVIGSDSIFERTIASEDDLKTLVYIAGRPK